MPQATDATEPQIWPSTVPDIWRLLNPKVTIERNLVRLLFGILALAFTGISVARGFSSGVDVTAVAGKECARESRLW